MPITDHWSGGGGHAYLRVDPLGGGTGNAPFLVRNLGGDPLYGKYPGGVPPTGGKTYHGAYPPEISQLYLALTTAGGSDRGGWYGRTRDLYL